MWSGLTWGVAAASAATIASEPFDYTETRWNTNVPGFYNGGTGWDNSWQVDLTQQPGHPVPQAAIFGTNNYDTYEPQTTYAWGHGGRLYRNLDAVLDTSPGAKIYFCVDMYTPETANSHVSGTLGGFGISIESQAAKPGELITYTPANNTWNEPKPAELTGLYGKWHRMTAEIEFFTTGSVMRAWIDASQESDPHEMLASTCTAFTATNFYIAHWGDSGYALVDNITIGTNFSQIALPLAVLGTNGVLITSGEAPSSAKGTLFSTILLNYYRTNVLVVTNSGTQPITLSGWATNGAGAGHFIIQGQPDSLAPGEAGAVSVVYHPTASGVHTATLSFSNNSAIPQRLINLSGSCASHYASPTNGAYGGGYEVTVWHNYGSLFTNVIVGEAAGVAPTEAAPDHLIFSMPTAVTAGPVNFVLQRAGDTDVTLTNAFTYAPAWFVVAPSNGPYAGGNAVTVTHGLNSVITNVVVRGVGVPTTGADTNGFTITMPAVEYVGLVNFTMQRAGMADVILGNAYTYNPAGFIGYADPDGWQDVPGLPEARQTLAAVAYSNKIYAMGGYIENGSPFDTVYCFDGTNWTVGDSLPYAMADLGAVSDGSAIYLGGSWGTTMYKYDGTGWAGMGDLSEARALPLMAMFNNRPVVVSGGTPTVSQFDGSNWADWFPLPYEQDIFGGAGGVISNVLYAGGGGFCCGALSSFWRNDGFGWTGVAGLPAARYYMASAVWREKIYALGGLDAGDNVVNTVMRFDGTGWSWAPSLPQRICVGAAAVLHDSLYSIGGYSEDAGAAVTNVYKYVEGMAHTGVSPQSGNLSGGYLVTIRGSNLGNGSDVTNVTICGVAAQSIVSQSATQIVVLAGASSAMTNGDVAVYSASFGVTARSNGFTYISLSSWTGPYAGGNTVTLTNITALGDGSDIMSVRVGGVAATVDGQGANWVRFILGPATNAGAADIVVQSTSIGETVFAASYTYNPPGVIGWRDPDGEWEQTVPLQYRVQRAPLVKYNNALYVIGGRYGLSIGTIYTNVCRFDGTNWEFVAGLPSTAMNLGAAVWDGAIYAAGNNATTVYRYDGAVWTTVAALPAARINPLLCVFSNRLHVLGGGSLTNVFVYDGTNWSETVGLPDMADRIAPAGGVLGDYLYLAGALDSASAWRFDGTEWTAAPSLDAPRGWLAAAQTPDRLYALGGLVNYAQTSDTLYFDGSRWQAGALLPYSTTYYPGAAELNGALYAVGGGRSNVLRMAVGVTHFGVSPSNGALSGGYEVTIGGFNLGDGSDVTNVTLCGVKVSSIVSQSSTQIVVVAAGGDRGLGDVRVYSTSFGETVKPNAFTYGTPQMLILGTNGAAVASGTPPAQALGTDFGVVTVFMARTTRLAITNSGLEALQITAWSTNGAGAGHFTLLDVPSTVDAGAVSNFSVVFDAALPFGVHTAAVSFVNDSVITPYQLCLRGTTYSPYEPDDTPAQAAWIARGETQIARTFYTGTDEDYICFTGELHRAYGVNLFNLNLELGAEAEMWVLGTNGVDLLVAGTSPTDLMLNYFVTNAGVYYARLASYDGFSVGSYDLELYDFGRGDVYEYDNTPAAASNFTAGAVQSHSIHHPDDVDVAKITVTANHLYQISVSNADVSASLILLDSDGETELVAEYSMFDDLDFGYLFTRAGDYYVRVADLGFTETGTYELVISDIGFSPGDAYEPDNSFGAASNIVPGVVQTNRTIHWSGDKDYITFDSPAYRYYTVWVTNVQDTLDAALAAYDQYTNQLASADDGGLGANESISFLQYGEGPVYLEVQRYDGTGRYDVVVYETGAILADAYEPDNAHTNARVLPVDVWQTNRTIHTTNDVDYVQVSVLGQRYYVFETAGSQGNLFAQLTLFDTNGVSGLATNVNGGPNGSARIEYYFENPGTYYLSVQAYNHDTAGSYSLRAQDTRIRRKWFLGAGAQLISSPALADDGTVYVGALDGRLFGLRLDGSTSGVWQIPGRIFGSPVLDGEGILYVMASNKVFALDIASGNTNWIYTNQFAGISRAAPALGTNHTLYAPMFDYRMHAIDLVTGTNLWFFNTIAGNFMEASPVIGRDGTIYWGRDNNKLYAIGPDGVGRWTNTFDSAIKGAPALTQDGHVLATTFNGSLYEVAPDGSIAHTWQTTGHVEYSSAVIGSNGEYYQATIEGELYSFHWNGTTNWVARLPAGFQRSSPAVGADGTVYLSAGTNRYMLAIAPDGSLLHQYDLGYGLSLDRSTPVIGTNGLVYVAAYGGWCYALYGTAWPTSGLASSPWPMAQGDAYRTGRATHDYAPRRVTVQSAYGLASPPAGQHLYPFLALLTNTVGSPDTRDATQFVCTGFSAQGFHSLGSTVTSVVYRLTNDVILSWLWTTNYWLDVTAGAHGQVGGGNGWVAFGATTQLTAAADTYYHFARWIGDASGSANPLALLVDAPKAVAAEFGANMTTNKPTPEWWLAQYGITTQLEQAVGADVDGDGIPTGDEWIMNSDPTNASSYLQLLDLSLTGGGSILSWPCATDRVYDVETDLLLLPGAWAPVPGLTNLVPASGWLVVTNAPDGAAQKFHRIKVRLP